MPVFSLQTENCVISNGHFRDRAHAEAVRRHIRNTQSATPGYIQIRNVGSVQDDAAAFHPLEVHDCRSEFRLAIALDASNAENLSSVHLQADAANALSSRFILHPDLAYFQNGRAGLLLGLIGEETHFTSEHELR